MLYLPHHKLPETLDERADRVESLCRCLADPQETSSLCIDLVGAIVDAMKWCQETERLAIEQCAPVLSEMNRIRREACDY